VIVNVAMEKSYFTEDLKYLEPNIIWLGIIVEAIFENVFDDYWVNGERKYSRCKERWSCKCCFVWSKKLTSEEFDEQLRVEVEVGRQVNRVLKKDVTKRSIPFSLVRF
jgi:hypothetical protein